MESSERIPICPAEKLSNRERASRRWVTVEPVVALAVIGYITIGLLRPFLLTARLRESLYNRTSQEEMSKCKESNHSDDSAMEADIQSQTSLWLLYLTTCINVPILFSTIVLGTLSDRLGRKLCMAIPLIGYICEETVYILTIYYDLPLPVLFVGEVLHGLTGGFGLIVSGCMSYLTDITTERQRTFRIAVAEMVVFFVGGVIQIGAGYLIRDVGLIPPLAVCLGTNVSCLIYIATPGVLLETVDRSTISEDRKGARAVWQSVAKLLTTNENGRRWQMLLLDGFLFFGLINIYSTMSIFVLYGTARPFCWTAVTAGLLGSFAFVTSSLGMLIGTKLLSICLGDYWIMQLSCLSLFLFDIVMAESTTTLLVFIANVFGTLRAMAFPVARSVISKIIDPAEIGAAFAIVACLDSLSSFTSNLLAPGVYAATVSYMPQVIFYTLSGLCAIPCALILILQIFWPQTKSFKPLHNGMGGFKECNVHETQANGKISDSIKEPTTENSTSI